MSMEIQEEMELIEDGVKVVFVNGGEGNSGEYDPNDPEDKNLLRIEFSRLGKGGEWEEVENSSYCTQVPSDTDRETLDGILTKVMGQLGSDVRSGSSVKRAMEELSWMTAEFGAPAAPKV